MANIVIESTLGNYHKITYNDMSVYNGIQIKYFYPEDIQYVYINNYGHITMKFYDDEELIQLSFDNANNKVDSVLGEIPTDNANLAELLINLRG